MKPKEILGAKEIAKKLKTTGKFSINEIAETTGMTVGAGRLL